MSDRESQKHLQCLMMSSVYFRLTCQLNKDSWWGSQLNGMNYAGGLVSLFNAGRGSWSAWLLVIRALRLRRFKLARQLKKWMGGGREAAPWFAFGLESSFFGGAPSSFLDV